MSFSYTREIKEVQKDEGEENIGKSKNIGVNKNQKTKRKTTSSRKYK